MTNDNCLEGVRCPRCGNEDRLFIRASILAEVTDDGADIARDTDIDWSDASATRCPDCGETGTLAHFQTKEDWPCNFVSTRTSIRLPSRQPFPLRPGPSAIRRAGPSCPRHQ